MSNALSSRGLLDHVKAHDVKNQLAIMLGFCELLSRTFADTDPRRNDVRQIEAAGRKALTLLDPGTSLELGTTMIESHDDARTVVLVVDDEAGVRNLSRRILEQGGYRVIEAANGRQALDLIDGGARVDFLMVDLDMPIMRGEILAERLRSVRPDLRVLYVTAHSEVLFTNRPELRTGEAFLDKPYSVKGLLEAVSLLKNGYINPPPAAGSVIDQMWRSVLNAVVRP